MRAKRRASGPAHQPAQRVLRQIRNSSQDGQDGQRNQTAILFCTLYPVTVSGSSFAAKSLVYIYIYPASVFSGKNVLVSKVRLVRLRLPASSRAELVTSLRLAANDSERGLYGVRLVLPFRNFPRRGISRRHNELQNLHRFRQCTEKVFTLQV